MKTMVGFRKIAVHDYQTININIFQKIIETHLQDYIHFANNFILSKLGE